MTQHKGRNMQRQQPTNKCWYSSIYFVSSEILLCRLPPLYCISYIWHTTGCVLLRFPEFAKFTAYIFMVKIKVSLKGCMNRSVICGNCSQRRKASNSDTLFSELAYITTWHICNVTSSKYPNTAKACEESPWTKSVKWWQLHRATNCGKWSWEGKGSMVSPYKLLISVSNTWSNMSLYLIHVINFTSTSPRHVAMTYMLLHVSARLPRPTPLETNTWRICLYTQLSLCPP